MESTDESLIDRVFATNFKFLIPISLQPNVEEIRDVKL